jgi:phosphate transport system substrate-binding protein
MVWGEAYGKKSGAVVNVSGGGSGIGLKALIAKTVDVANSSREIKKEEQEQATKNGVTPVETIVGWDGIAVVVHPENTVKQLTLAQLAGIYTGNIKDWKEVGGKAGAIVAAGREPVSGTYVFFKEHVLLKGTDYASTVLALNSNQAIVSEIAGNTSAIGYVGLGFVTPKVRALPVAKDAAGKAVEPSTATVVDKTYPISRPLLVYTNGQPAGEVKGYIDFVLSPEGQKILEDNEFVPVK